MALLFVRKDNSVRLSIWNGDSCRLLVLFQQSCRWELRMNVGQLGLVFDHCHGNFHLLLIICLLLWYVLDKLLEHELRIDCLL